MALASVTEPEPGNGAIEESGLAERAACHRAYECLLGTYLGRYVMCMCRVG